MDDEATVLCSEKFSSCECDREVGHEGPHVCECGGSWDHEGNVVNLPQRYGASSPFAGLPLWG